MPKDFQNRFNTKLDPDQQKKFDTHSKMFPQLIADKVDYDTQGFYKEIYQKYSGDYDQITKALTPDSPTAHVGTDKYKKPNHPTFSNESRYSFPIIRKGGHWDYQDKRDVFVATKRNIKNMEKSDGSPLKYFLRAEDYNLDGRPDVGLIYKKKNIF